MYIMVPTGMEIINSEFVERFCVVEKPDAALVVASYDRSTVGAHTLYHGERVKKDARVKRRGGS